MSRKISVLVVLLLALALSPSVANASISVKPWPSGNSVVFGKKKFLEVKVRGYSQGELADGRIVIRQAEFPYRNFKVVANLQATSALRYIPIKPRINSRYRATFVGKDAGGEAASTTVYVNPRARGLRMKTGNGFVRYSSYREVYSSALARRWRKVPRKRKPIYFYNRCRWSGGRISSKPYRLRGRSTPRTKVKRGKLIILWPSFRYRTPCAVGSPVFIGLSKMPGYLRNGDDGAGAPNSTARRYRKISRLAGRSKIPRKKAQAVLGWP